MEQWHDLTADDVERLLEGGLDPSLDPLSAAELEADAEDDVFLKQVLQELEGKDVDDPADGLDTTAPAGAPASDEEEYWLPGEAPGTPSNEEMLSESQHKASERSTRSGPIGVQNGSNQHKQPSQSRKRRQLAKLIRNGLMSARHIRSALSRGKAKLSIAQQRSQRVKDSFLVNPSEQSPAGAADAPKDATNKPEVYRRKRSQAEEMQVLQNKANAAKSDLNQAEERLHMLAQKAGDAGRIESQKQVVKHALSHLTAANSEMLAFQVRYMDRKLPAGRAYTFFENGKKQGPFSAQHMVKVVRLTSVGPKTEVLVDSSLMNQGTMWVYVDALIPLLEPYYLVNSSYGAGRRRPVQPPHSANGKRARRQSRWGREDSRNEGRLSRRVFGGGDVEPGGRGNDMHHLGTHSAPAQDVQARGEDRSRWSDSGARLRGNSADAQRSAQEVKREQLKQKYEDENAILHGELTLEMYTLETKEGDMWGPHSYEALAGFVESKEILEDVELMYDTEYGVSIISYVDLNLRIKERREKVQRLQKNAHDADLKATPERAGGPPQSPPHDGFSRERCHSPGVQFGADGRQPPIPMGTSTPHGEPEPLAADSLPRARSLQLESLPGPSLMPATVAASSVAAHAPRAAERALPFSPVPMQSAAGQVNGFVHHSIVGPQAYQIDQGAGHQRAADVPQLGIFGAAGSAEAPTLPPPLPPPRPTPRVAVPVGIETVQAGATALELAPGFPAVQPFNTPLQPPGYGVTEAPAAVAMPTYLPPAAPVHEAAAPAPMHHAPQLPPPPIEVDTDEIDSDIENMQFNSFQDLMHHVQENEMEHAYQVILNRAGQQRPTRMAQLDVKALVAFKDSPLHIAEQALKEFVSRSHDPENASELFRGLLGHTSMMQR